MNKTNKRSPLLILFFIVFIDLVGFGIVIPILPYYAKEFGASGFQLGLLMMVYSLMQFLVSPIWGRMSDRHGRRPILLGSLLGTGLSFLFLGFTQSLPWLFIGRILAGTCGANISTAYAYISDVTTEENRAKGMGIIGAGFGLGFIFGPAIGGILSQWGYGAPMFAASALCLINFLFAIRLLEEPPLTSEQREKNRGRKFNLETIKISFSNPLTKWGIVLFFLSTLAVAQMETTFAIYLFDRFGYNAKQAGYLLALSGIIGVLIQGGLIGKLSKKFGEKNLICFGMLLGGVGFVCFAKSNDLTQLITSLCLMSLGLGVVNPSISSLTSKGAPAETRGVVMGVYHSMGSLARVLGPPSAGFFFDQIHKSFPYFCAAFLFWIGALGISPMIKLPNSNPR